MDGLRQKYIEAIAAAPDEDALEALRVAAVGKKGEISLKMRELGKMSPDERKTAGPAGASARRRSGRTCSSAGTLSSWSTRRTSRG